jgi:hypothetical protein
MKELLRTNDPVFLSWVEATLADANIEAIVFDRYTSAVEGSIGALPRRIMVHDDDLDRAQQIVNTAKAGVGQ